jgi:hypothetical protein
MWLKQSTVAVINFGPVVDKGDGVTLETGILASLDHATTGIMLSKNGGTLAVREQGANFVATTYDAHGCYKVSLSAVDTGTLGRLRVIHTEPATYLAAWQDFMIVPANVWDSMFGADKLDVAVVEQANIDFGALQKASITAAAPTANGIADQVWDEALSGHVAAGSTGKRLNDLVATGAGAIAWTYTLTSSVSPNPPIADADVWVTTDIGGANVIASGKTNASGVVTFYLDAGTVYVWRQKSGFDFSNPDTEILS